MTRDSRPAARLDPRPEEETATGAGHRILCAQCRHPITTEAARRGVNGSHEHRCINPHGFVFRIGCFGVAPGCQMTGSPTTEFTWFGGFAWCYALCGGCGMLLGWRYHSEQSAFFGLILDRLVSEDAR